MNSVLKPVGMKICITGNTRIETCLYVYIVINMLRIILKQV